MGDAMVLSAVVIGVLMVGTWVVSLAVRNASIVDVVWGLGFTAVAWTGRVSSHGNSARQWLLTVMVSVWGLRLAGYLFWRNHGKGEDFRYRAMRKRWGPRFPLASLLTVFVLQGTLMWIVSLGVQLGQTRRHPGIGPVAIIGVVLWAGGLAFEAIGDAQLARFKADPSSAGKVMNRGLWRYTRHPNYFGDATLWWGIALVAAETGAGAWGLLGAAVMSWFLIRISGVAMLERSLRKRREGYEEYIATTSSFIPMPPRRPRRVSA